MRFVAFALLACAAVSAATTEEIEKQLRERASSFYQLQVDRKYRQSEEYVTPEDRDTYYAMEKPQIKDYKIRKLTLNKDHESAVFEMTSNTKLRRAMIGEVEMSLTYLSHWKYEQGNWFWYIPTDEVQQTPFGPMHFTKNGLEKAPDPNELRKRITSGGALSASLQQGVKANASSVAVGPYAGNASFVTLENTLSGGVDLAVGDLKSKSLTASLSKAHLGPGEKAILRISRTKDGTAQPLHVVVSVKPTNQMVDVLVN